MMQVAEDQGVCLGGVVSVDHVILVKLLALL